jgi:hypothetical protein
MEEKIEEFHIHDKKQDFLKTVYGKILVENLKKELIYSKRTMENIKQELEENFELNKYATVIAEDILELNSLLSALSSWDELITKAKEFNFQTWPIDKKNVSPPLLTGGLRGRPRSTAAGPRPAPGTPAAAQRHPRGPPPRAGRRSRR